MTSATALTPTSRAAEPRSRGDLVVSRRVVEKIAGQAASEVAAAGGRSGGFLGIGAHTDLTARPKVDVELSGRTATIAVDVTVAYPASIRQSTDRVRQQVGQKVSELTGLTVNRIDITVVAVHRAGSTTQEELR